MDLISRQDAIDAIEKLDIPEDMCVFEILSHIELAIGTLPSAEPCDNCIHDAEDWDSEACDGCVSAQRKGKWIVCDAKPPTWWYECSLCGSPGNTNYNFCPNCGARMER